MTRLAFVATAIVASLVLVATAEAATLTGRLDGARGARLVVVMPSGQSRSVELKGRPRFALRLPAHARGATLHVVRGGRYGGPVLLAMDKRRARVALSGRGGKLGRLRMVRGYAMAVRPVAPRLLARGRGIRTTRRGAPVGAGRLGLGVRPKGGKRAMAAQAGPPGGPGQDADGDGLPATFDVDDDGDGTLDATDRDQTEPPPVKAFSRLRLGFPSAGNAHLPGSLAADAILGGKRTFILQFNLWPSGPIADVTDVDVDCAALAYCRTAEIADEPGEGAPADIPMEAKWTSYDRNGNGRPDLYARR